MIKALTWRFLPDQSYFHVHSGQMWDLRGIYSFRTAILAIVVALHSLLNVMTDPDGGPDGGVDRTQPAQETA